MKRAAWIQSLSGLPFSRIAEAIRAADQAMAQSTSFVNDFLEDVIMFGFLSVSAFATIGATIGFCIRERYVEAQWPLGQNVSASITRARKRFN